MALHGVATMPDGQPMTPSFLSDITGMDITAFCVDAASIIKGRHSTTFRIFLQIPNRPTDRGRSALCHDPCSEEDPTSDDKSPGPVSQIKTGQRKQASSLFVKRVVCKDLPPRSLSKWRTCIASYRAETSFFLHMASLDPLREIVPICYWLHMDDRQECDRCRGDRQSQETHRKGSGLTTPAPDARTMIEGREEGSVKSAERQTTESLIGSSFMIVTEDLTINEQGNMETPDQLVEHHGWEQVGAMDMERAKRLLSATALLHGSFWQKSTTSAQDSIAALHGHGQSEAGSNATVKQGGDGQSCVSRGSTKHTSVDSTSLEYEERKIHQNIREAPTQFNAGNDCNCRKFCNNGLHEHGTFWSLEKRAPEDLQGLVNEYEKLLERFRPLLPTVWFIENDDTVRGASGPRHLGKRLHARAVELDAVARGVDEETETTPRTRVGRGIGRTLIHGDLKTWNVFFRRANGARSKDPGVKIIDWQWCGSGLAAADVAYMCCTGLHESVLGSEEILLRHYYEELAARLVIGGNGDMHRQEEGVGSGRDDCMPAAKPSRGEVAYSYEDFLSDYRLAFLDYVRCILSTLWKDLTPEKMDSNRTSGPGMSMINRSPAHMRWIIERATRFLDELDGDDAAQRRKEN